MNFRICFNEHQDHVLQHGLRWSNQHLRRQKLLYRFISRSCATMQFSF